MIKSIINRMSLLALLMATGACSSKSSKTESKEMETEENLYVSQPFTSKSEFTGGIEGPAVDKEGNLYVVNFGKIACMLS